LTLQELLRAALALLPEVGVLRRVIHRPPKLGLDVPHTQARVLDALHNMPLETRFEVTSLASLHTGEEAQS
jgi:hippurate hydrolase